MALLEAEGTRRVHYEHHAGRGPAVLLIPGWGVSLRCWDPVLRALLDAGRETLLVDARGCGGSDRDFADRSIAALGGDVARVVDASGLDAVVLNGWSMGGAVAVEAASRLGERVRGLVLTAAATPRYTAAPDWPEGVPAEALRENLRQLATNRAAFLRELAGGVFHAALPEAVPAWLWQLFMETTPTADASLANLGEVDQRTTLRSLRLPALVAGGRNDPVVPLPIAERAAELLPRARLEVFEKSGHAPFLEETERYVQRLLAFLDGLGNEADA